MMKKPSTRERGSAAETRAAVYLQSQGLRVLERNIRCRAGELDLVCRDGETIVIVEVKQRSRRDFGGALGAVTWRKRQRIVRTATYYWQLYPEWRRHTLRFDVIALQNRGGAEFIEWIKDAFC